MRTLGLVVLGLVALAVALFAFVVGTPPGARLAFQLFAPEELEMEQVDGRLWGDLQMQGVRWAHERADVTIGRLAVRWSPRALFDRAVVVDHLRAAGVTVRLRPPAPDEAGRVEGLPDVELPVRVRIDSAVAAGIIIHPAPPAAEGPLLEEPLRLERLALRADVGRDGSVDFVAEAGAPEAQPGFGVEARIRGRLVARGTYPMELWLEWEARPGEEPTLAGAGHAAGDLERLALTHRLHEPVAARLEAEARELLAELAWSVVLEVPRFRLAEVRRDWPAHAAEARLEASGGRERARGTGSARLFPEEGGEVTAFLEGRYAAERFRLDSLVLGAPPAEGRLTATGEVFLDEESPRFRLVGRWSGIRWPPSPGTAWAARRAAAGAGGAWEDQDAQIASPEGEFRVEGTTARYAARLRMRLEGPDIPAGDWRLAVTGDGAALVISDLRGRILEGDVQGTGRLSWSPVPSGRLELAGDGLRPEVWIPRWPGELDFRLAMSGELRDGVRRLSLALDELSGTLRDEPATMTMRAQLAGERVQVDTIWARYGDATLQARGVADERWDVSWAADIPHLSLLAADTLSPELGGSLQARGEITGARRSPEVAFALGAEDLQARDFRVAEAQGTGAVDLSGGAPSRLRLLVTGFHTHRGPDGGLELDELVLRGQGTPDDHRLSLMGSRAEDGFDVTLAGGLVGAEAGAPATARAWEGRVEELGLETDGMVWRLRQTPSLEAGPDMARFEPLCLEQVEGPSARAGAMPEAGEAPHACLSGSWARDTGARGELAVVALPLELFARFMPAEFEATGDLTLRVEGGLGPEREAWGTGSLRVGPGRLIYVAGPGRRMERPYEVVALDLQALEGALEASLEVEMVGGAADGFARFPLDAEEGGRSLEGRLAARFDDRGLLGALSLELEETAGLLEAELALSGTTEEPQATGWLSLTEGAANILTLGIRVHDVELEATGETRDRWRITGAVRSGEGELEVEGAARLATAAEAWEVDAAIRGERFEAYNTADAWILASPDLRAQGSPEGLLFTGSVHLPFGRITPEDLQLLAIEPSEDVVLVGPGTEGIEEEVPLPVPIRAEIELVAGDSLLFEAMGVEGRVVGSLALSYGPDRPTTARGELDVVEGTYTAYHQELEIERGRLIYPDVPLTNPGLDIRVSREPREGIRVGLDVRGTAREPDARLFSEPLMAEAEALSWLLLGRSLAGAEADDGELLAGAARSAGLAGGELLAGRIAAAFGLEEARLERDPEGGAFILGAQVAPNLYVAYTIGIFEAADVLNIRYELGRWTFTTQTGFETAADVLYRAGGEELPAPELVPELGGETIGGETIRRGGVPP